MIKKSNMRIILLMLLMSIGSIILYSQGTSRNLSLVRDSESIKAIIYYVKDGNGFWVKHPPMMIDQRPDSIPVILIGKNNGTRSVYGLTETSFLQFFMSKGPYSEYKKNKLLPNIKDKEWTGIFMAQEEVLQNTVQQLNEIRTKEIEDSIAEQQRIARIKAEEEARIRDSILAVETEKQMRLEDEEYRKTHSKRILDISSLSYGMEKQTLECIIDDCRDIVPYGTISPFALKADTLAFANYKEGPLHISQGCAHAIKITHDLRNNYEINRYLRAWGDSLNYEEGSIAELIDLFNYVSAKDLISKVKKEAPYGYIEDWSWDYEYGPVTLYVKYCNTNAKTIKYIKFFFTVYNDVDDVRGRGSVQGTGPLEEFESASWDFDWTGCWPSGDASRMKITKIVITYMNGSTITLSGKNIKFE